ncbi:hypothetical protein V6N13_046263 [Hibiscus sabdariffa]
MNVYPFLIVGLSARVMPMKGWVAGVSNADEGSCASRTPAICTESNISLLVHGAQTGITFPFFEQLLLQKFDESGLEMGGLGNGKLLSRSLTSQATMLSYVCLILHHMLELLVFLTEYVMTNDGCSDVIGHPSIKPQSVSFHFLVLVCHCAPSRKCMK